MKRRGFTLIEIMVAFGVGLIILGVVAIISINFVKNREITIVSETLVSYLRAAEQRALASEGNTNHGVSKTGGKLTLFRGTSYQNKITAYDTVLPYPSYITFTGLGDVIFSKQTGAPLPTGTITISNGIRSAVITVYSTGAISQ
jgi:type II secretory pathway pseudopilin PulG